MKRSGFTMIELIFVIVILGILAAVALPKFIGVGEQAHTAKVVDFTSTLNRTVMPQIWSKAISDGYNGDITKVVSTKEDLEKYTQIPEEITDVNMTNAATGHAVMFGEIQDGWTFKTDNGNEGTAKTYLVFCTKGSSTTTPYCKAYLTTVIDTDAYNTLYDPTKFKTLTK
jgi:prepilin-type N-terminal cleavage/methylation domain-containing protein